PDNASGFKENININDLFADTHVLWNGTSSLKLMTGADLLFAAGEAKGATFTYTAPLDGSSQASVAEPTTLDKDAEDERRSLGGQPALINAGSTRFKGFELATDLRLPREMSARASYSFHDGKFVDFVQDFGGVPTQLAGKRFEMSARHLASAGLTLAPDRGITATATVNYSGDRYLNKRNSALAGAFSTIDVGVGYRTGSAEFRIDGRNLGDRR